MKRFRLLLCISLLMAYTGTWAWAQGPVRLGGEWVELPANKGLPVTNTKKSTLRGGVSGEERQVVLQFTRRLTAADHAKLQALGVRLESYLDGGAYRATLLPEAHIRALNRLPFLRGIHTMRSEWKLAKSIKDQRYPTWAVDGDRVKLVVYTGHNASQDAVAHAINKLGARVVYKNPRMGMMGVEMEREQVVRLADIPGINYVTPTAPKAEVTNRSGSALNRVATLRIPQAHGGRELTGEGVVVGIWDGNVLHHPDFGKRVHNMENEMGTAEDHGTHVAGSVLGSGMVDERARGMAPKAVAYTGNFGDQKNGMPESLEMIEAYESLGVRITQNSYGIPLQLVCPDYYNLRVYAPTDYALDLLAHAEPKLIHVVAAGNDRDEMLCTKALEATWGVKGDGYGTATWHAKNPIYVGAVDEDGELSDFSSMGPLQDGRLYPTVCAKGVDVYSCSSEAGYMAMDGTSMACPQTSGGVALMQERWHQLHQGDELRSDVARAILANTARDAGNPGPDYGYGYGIVDFERALTLMEKGWYRVDSLEAVDEKKNESKEYSIAVPEGVKELRVMLVWNDEPDNAHIGMRVESTLINDLDLTVQYDGKEYLPWVCSHDSGEVNKPAERRVDNLNTIEQVTLKDPQPGMITATVKGTQLPLGGQEFALVWWFEKPEQRIVYPNGAVTLASGEVEVLHVEGMGDDYQVEVSLDGGNTYIPNDIHAQKMDIPYSNKRLYVPDGLTQQFTIRVIHEDNIIESEQPLIVAPRVKGLTLESDGASTCSCTGYTLKWENTTTATQGYVVLKGDVSTEQFTQVNQVAAGTAEFSLPLPTAEELDKGVVYTVCAVLPDGETWGPRAVGVLPSGAERYSVPPVDGFIAEEFIDLPSRKYFITTGANVSANWLPRIGGDNLEHVLSFKVNNTAKEEKASFEQSFEDYKGSITFCVPDLSKENKDEYPYIIVSFKGLFASRNNEGEGDMAVRVLDNGTPVKDVLGRNVVYNKQRDNMLEFSYQLPNDGESHKLTLEAVSTMKGDEFILAAVEFAGKSLQRLPELTIVDQPLPGSRLGVEMFSVVLGNPSYEKLPKGILYATVNGVEQRDRVKQVEELHSGEYRMINIPVDLTSHEELGEEMKVEVVYRGEGFEERTGATVRNYGSVLVHPTSEKAEGPGGFHIFDPFVVDLVEGKAIIADNGGIALGDDDLRSWYPSDQVSTWYLLPSNKDKMLRFTLKKAILNEEDFLSIYTHSIPEKVNDLLLSGPFDFEVDMLPPQHIIWGEGASVNVLEGEPPLEIVSQDPSGGLVFHFRAGEDQAEGWEGVIEEIPRENKLTLHSATMQALEAEEDTPLTVTLVVENHYPQSTEGTVSIASYDGEPIASHTLNLAPGKKEYTFEVEFGHDVPMWKPVHVVLLSDVEQDYIDNALDIQLIKDRIKEPPPASCIPDGVKFGYNIEMGESISVYVDNDEREMAFPYLVAWSEMERHEYYNSWELALPFTKGYPIDLVVSAWWDVNANGVLEDNEIISVTLEANSTDCTLELPSTAIDEKLHRLRLFVGEETLSMKNAHAVDFWHDVVDVNVKLSNESLLPEANIMLSEVSIGKSGKNLSAQQPVIISVYNGWHRSFDGEISYTVTADKRTTVTNGKGTISFADNPLEAGEFRENIKTGATVDLTTKGFKEVIVKLDDGEEMTAIISSVVPDSEEQPKGLWGSPQDYVMLYFGHSENGKKMLNSIEDECTLEFWCNPIDYVVYDFFTAQNLSITRVQQSGVKDKKERLFVEFTESKKRVYTDGVSIPAGEWTHIALSMSKKDEKNQVTLVINGEEVPLKGELDAFNMNELGNGRLLGSIDQLRLWKKARSVADIRADMYKKLENPDGTFSKDDLLCEFHFTEGPGNTLATSGDKYINVEVLTEEMNMLERPIDADNAIWRYNGNLLKRIKYPIGVKVKEEAGVYELVLPEEVDITSVPIEVYTLWPGAEVKVDGTALPNGRGNVDLSSKGVTLTVELAEFFGHKKGAGSGYVEKFTLTAKQAEKFGLENLVLSADNEGLTDAVELPIASTIYVNLEPTQGELKNPKKVKVKFTYTGATLFINGTEQRGSEGVVDLTAPCNLRVTNAAGESKYYTLVMKGAKPQNITWTLAQTEYTYGDEPIDLSSVKAEGGAVVFESSNTKVATVMDGKLYFHGAGTATITAKQSGNRLYQAASPVEQTITVKRKGVTIRPKEEKSIPFGDDYELLFDVDGVVSEDDKQLIQYGNFIFVDAQGVEQSPLYLIGPDIPLDDEDESEGEPNRLFLPYGKYTITPEVANYQTSKYDVMREAGDLEVAENPEYTCVTLRITSEGKPVEGALVKIFDASISSDIKGEVKFACVRGHEEFYSVEADGYVDATGTVKTDKGSKEKVENVTMHKPTGRVTYTVSATGGGMVMGETIQELGGHRKLSPVEAVPYVGYKLDKWSDNKVEEERLDNTLTKGNHTFEASFVERDFTIDVEVQEGGKLKTGEERYEKKKLGETISGFSVAAESGYYFQGWSDGCQELDHPEVTVTGDAKYVARFGKVKDLPYEYDFSAGELKEGWHAYTEGDFDFMWEVGDKVLGRPATALDGNWAYCYSGAEGLVWGRMEAYLMFPRFDIKEIKKDVLVDFDYVIVVYRLGQDENSSCVLQYSTDGEEWFDVDKILEPQLSSTAVRKHGTYNISGSVLEGSSELYLRLKYETTTDHYVMVDNIKVSLQSPEEITYTYTVSPKGAGTIEGKEKVTHTLVKNQMPHTVEAVPTSGYRFVHWAETGNKSPVLRHKKPAVSNKTFTAQFELVSFSVVYEPNGGVGTSIRKEYEGVDEVELLQNSFTREGYTFVGWSMLTDGGDVLMPSEKFLVPKVATRGSITLYAQWKQDEPTPGENETKPKEEETTPVESQLLAEVALYPNPTSKSLFLKNVEAVYSVTLTDAMGRQLLTQRHSGASLLTLDVSGFRDGVYFVVLRAQDGSQRVIRFLKLK